MEYTQEELYLARNVSPDIRTDRDKQIIRAYRRGLRWKKYYEEKAKNKEYTVQLPKPWDVIGTPRDLVNYTKDERVEAERTARKDRTARQWAILKTYNSRRYYAYNRKHSPVPKEIQHITRILTDIDNVEDILATAAFASYAIGIIIPLLAPIFEALGGILSAACVPLNLIEASLGLATGPMGMKRGLEGLIKLTPAGRIMKVAHVGLLGKIADKIGLTSFIEKKAAKGISEEMASKIFKQKITKEIERKEGKYLGTRIAKLPLKERLKYAMPSWGTMLEAGQAAQTITGYGLLLGPIFGTASDAAFAGVRYVNGEKVKFYWPWEKPDLETRMAATTIKSTSRLLAHPEMLTPHQQLKTTLAHAWASWKLSKYLEGKDISPYAQEIGESDSTTETEPTAATRDAMESLNYEVDTNDKSYLQGETQVSDDTVARYEARTVQGEMQAILPHAKNAIKKILETHKGLLSSQPISEAITTAAESTASAISGGEQNITNDLRADFKVALTLVKYNILPTPLQDYGSGFPRIAFGFTPHYTKGEVLQQLNTILRMREKQIEYGNAAVEQWQINEEIYKFWWRLQRIPKDYKYDFEFKYGVKLNDKIERPEHYYSWYYDQWDYWRKELQKLTHLYVKGLIKLTPQDILKHIGYPEPTLYDNSSGKTTHKKLNWIFNQNERWDGHLDTYNIYVKASIKKWWEDKYHSVQWMYYGVPDDLFELLANDVNNYTTEAYMHEMPIEGGYREIWALDLSSTNRIIEYKKWDWNKQLVHTFRALDTITETDEMFSGSVFNTTAINKEVIAKRKRLIGCSIPVIFYPNYYDQNRPNTTPATDLMPLNLKFYIFKNPPLWIRTQEELTTLSKTQDTYPVWLKNTRLRNIFHKWLVTRPYDYEFKPLTLSLDILHQMYNDMAYNNIKLPSWPHKTVEKYKEAGKDIVYKYTESGSEGYTEWETIPQPNITTQEKTGTQATTPGQTTEPERSQITINNTPSETTASTSGRQPVTTTNARKTASTQVIMPPQTTNAQIQTSNTEQRKTGLNTSGTTSSYNYTGQISY